MRKALTSGSANEQRPSLCLPFRFSPPERCDVRGRRLRLFRIGKGSLTHPGVQFSHYDTVPVFAIILAVPKDGQIRGLKNQGRLYDSSFQCHPQSPFPILGVAVFAVRSETAHVSPRRTKCAPTDSSTAARLWIDTEAYGNVWQMRFSIA